MQAHLISTCTSLSISQDLGLLDPAFYHVDHVQSTLYNLRFSKYKEPKKTGIDVGLGTQTDKTFTTILHQNHVNCLEISTKDDEWIGREYPLPSSFLFLAGDVLQVWSNDRIQPCRHRDSLTENKVRYSFGFYSIKEGVTNIPEELVDKDHPLRFKPLNHLEYARARYGSNGTDSIVKAYVVFDTCANGFACFTVFFLKNKMYLLGTNVHVHVNTKDVSLVFL